MNHSEKVRELAKMFLRDNIGYLGGDYDFMDNVRINKKEISKFYIPQIKYNREISGCVENVLIYLIFNSINFCYWYGSNSIYPDQVDNKSGNSGSSFLLYLVESSVKEGSFDDIFETLVEKLIKYKIPYLKDRILNLKEILIDGKENTQSFKYMIEFNNNNNAQYILNKLINNYPISFADDMFLKRAQLLIKMLYENFGFFQDNINTITVPADYQIPKVLEYYRLIEYDEKLKNIIKNKELIPKGSSLECQIRAATILTCDYLAEVNNINTCMVDTFLFNEKNNIYNPFHLTITTDY